VADDEIDGIKKLLGRPVAYYVSLAQIGGSVNAGLVISQALYWAGRTSDPDGWFYKSQADWQSEIGLTRSELDGARALLRKANLIHEAVKGFPAKTHYRVNLLVLREKLSQFAENQQTDSLQKTSKLDVENQQTSLQKTSKLVCRNSASSLQKTCKPYKEAETTTETTSEITTENKPSARCRKRDEDLDDKIESVRRFVESSLHYTRTPPGGSLANPPELDWTDEDERVLVREVRKHRQMSLEQWWDAAQVFAFVSRDVEPLSPDIDLGTIVEKIQSFYCAG
jgi:hypothetical protein